MKITAKYSDMDKLIADMDQGMRELMPEVAKVTSKGAVNIKNGWRDRWSGHPHIPHLPRAISYDLDEGTSHVEAEIGPAHEKLQGTLGHIIEFGNVEYGNLRNAPIPGGLPALEDEAPRFEQALADAAEKMMASRGMG